MIHLVDAMLIALFIIGALIWWEAIARWLERRRKPKEPRATPLDIELRALFAAVDVQNAQPAAALPPPGGDRPGALPPPPAKPPCPHQGPELLFQRNGATQYEQELANAHWALGFWCGKSFPGGFVCDARVRH